MEIRISVRELVEFILRQGDIDNRISGNATKQAMLLGGKLHRKIQKSMNSFYHAEVPLFVVHKCKEFDLKVEGRADGIIIKDNEVTVDEIKGVLKSVSKIEEPIVVHLSQAKCYAYLYGTNKKFKLKDTINVQMTYVHMLTEEIKRFNYTYTYKELKEWFENLISEYEKWALFEINWKQKRNESIKYVEFPYEYRDGQRQITVDVYRSILRQKQLFIQAPTGVGKTMSTVFPSVKALGEGLADSIFYLTARTITRTVAEDAFNILREQNLKMKVITLTAKNKICPLEETNCNPYVCPYAKGHFDRVNDAIFDFINTKDEWTREAILEQSKKYTVCPFEMALDASIWADAVICDYNYVFDPDAHLRRFFDDDNNKDKIFLIDEAHNLVERGRNMYSASIYKEDIMNLKKLVKHESPTLYKRLDECNRQLLTLKRECESVKIVNSITFVILKLLNVMSELEDFLEDVGEDIKDEVLDVYFSIRKFLNIYDLVDDNYVVYTELEYDGRFKVELMCMNPANNLSTYMEKARSSIMFSATLLPVNYYKELLSTRKDDYAIYANSPFDKSNRGVFIATDVSTKYTMRTEEMYEKYKDYILRTIKVKNGNYMAFFPSYQLLKDVYRHLENNVGKDIELVVQNPSMTEEDREEFIALFETKRDKTLLGLCVMGGIFSEGIDLTGDSLIGVLIIGTGLPMVCTKREILRDYFNKKDGSGFDTSYLNPGMNKVLQSAGRVIRTAEDKGIVLLLDERFNESRYRQGFPREWDNIKMCNLDSISGEIEEFWKRK